MKRALLVVLLLLGFGASADAQMNGDYQGLLVWSVGGTSGPAAFSAAMGVVGVSTCPPNGCPEGAQHSATIIHAANYGSNCGPGGQCGGTYTNLSPSCPTCYMTTTQIGVALNANPMYVYYQAQWKVICTVVGLIQQNVFFPAGTLLESGITWSTTTVGSANMKATSATCGVGYTPDWAGITTNPYGSYPVQTDLQIVEQFDVLTSSSGSKTGPWIAWGRTGQNGTPWYLNGFRSEPPAECTKASAAVFPFWQ